MSTLPWGKFYIFKHNINNSDLWMLLPFLLGPEVANYVVFRQDCSVECCGSTRSIALTLCWTHLPGEYCAWKFISSQSHVQVGQLIQVSLHTLQEWNSNMHTICMGGKVAFYPLFQPENRGVPYTHISLVLSTKHWKMQHMPFLTACNSIYSSVVCMFNTASTTGSRNWKVSCKIFICLLKSEGV